MASSFSLFYFVFGFLLFFYHSHCAAIINRTIDHHQHQNDHVLNIQTASIMVEGARPSIVFGVSFGNGTAQHACRPWSILLCDAVFFISSCIFLTTPPRSFHVLYAFHLVQRVRRTVYYSQVSYQKTKKVTKEN